MKTFILATAIVLSLLTPLAHADEASQKAIAEDLLKTIKIDQMMEPFFEQMKSIMEQQFTQMGAPEEMKPILKRYIDKLFNIIGQDLSWLNLREDIINIYVRSFTEEELKGILAFYKSPVGQSVISKMPATMQQSLTIMQKRVSDIQGKIKKISEELAEEVKAEIEKKEKEKEQCDKPDKAT